MGNSYIDLSEFALKYRQALLFTMIEGLNDGGKFTFIDQRAPEEIESELLEAGLIGYQWKQKTDGNDEKAVYIIEKRAKETAKGGCCGGCGGQS